MDLLIAFTFWISSYSIKEEKKNPHKVKLLADGMIIMLHIQNLFFFSLSLVVEDLMERERTQVLKRQVSNLNRNEILPLSFYFIHWKGADCWLNNRRVDLFRA